MEKPQKEPIPLNQNQDFKLCLQCGFPNRPNDAKCMFCEISFREKVGLIVWFKQIYYVLQWRWDLIKRRYREGRGNRKFSFLKALGYFFLGMVLSVGGLILLIDAVNRNSFSSGLIAILILIYGFFTLKILFSKKS